MSSLLMLSACGGVQDLGSSIKYKVQGEYYLQNEKYKKGKESFEEAIRENPANDDALYYYGRFLIETEQSGKALKYLKKAVQLNPDNADYSFWLGVAYGEQGDNARERQNYQRALKLDPKHVMALINLGHNNLRQGRLQQSLENYQKALALKPYDAQALYNRALILKKLGRTPEEKVAWRQYLDFYPAGAFARRAADHLNALGDYSYRNHSLGIRNVTLTDIGFIPFTAELSGDARMSLNLVGATVANMPSGVLQVLVFQLHNLDLAKDRAQAIRSYLYEQYPVLRKEKRVRLSWFDTPEQRQLLGKTLAIDESVKFFLTDMVIKKHITKAKTKTKK